MFRLKIGYFVMGIATGILILFSFIWTLPDGKLHVVFCNVGQGDGAYIRFPNGRDMVVDGGPDEKKILNCLNKYMPFWDRQINLVVMTHPQKDHLQGLIPVLERYDVDYFIRSDVDNITEGYKRLMEVVERKKIPIKFMTTGEIIKIDKTQITMIWPSEEKIAKGKNQFNQFTNLTNPTNLTNKNILGASAGELNDYSLVFNLHYGTFDILFTGDADNHVNREFIGTPLLSDTEVLKVPHHGSRTGMTEEFLDWVKPKLAIISVGKNNYGHPGEDTLAKLATRGTQVKRTDKDGDIEVVSDGKNWKVTTQGQ